MFIMKKLVVLCVLGVALMGCSKKEPNYAMDGGFSSMKDCISSVKKETGQTPKVEYMNEVKVMGTYNGLSSSEGTWSCEMKTNSTGLPFYGYFNIDKKYMK